MQAYSVDLRAKVMEAYLHHEGSIRHLATRFKVSPRFVWGLVNRSPCTSHSASFFWEPTPF
jgi:transposase